MSIGDYNQITESEAALMDLVRHKRFLDLERIPLICSDISAIRKMMEEEKIERTKLVTQDQFYPIKVIAYGFVGITMTAVVGAILALVLKK